MLFNIPLQIIEAAKKVLDAKKQEDDSDEKELSGKTEKIIINPEIQTVSASNQRQYKMR